MYRKFVRRLAAVVISCACIGSATAQTPPPAKFVPKSSAFKALPKPIRDYVSERRQWCLNEVVHYSEEKSEAEQNYAIAKEMGGVHETMLGGRPAIIVDNIDLCTSDIVGGNCHNAGCPFNVWLEMSPGNWRKVSDQHLQFLNDDPFRGPEALDLAPRYRTSDCRSNRSNEACTLRWRFRRSSEQEKMSFGPAAKPDVQAAKPQIASQAPGSESAPEVKAPEIEYPPNVIDNFGGVWGSVSTGRSEGIFSHTVNVQMITQKRVTEIEYVLQMRSASGQGADISENIGALRELGHYQIPIKNPVWRDGLKFVLCASYRNVDDRAYYLSVNHFNEHEAVAGGAKRDIVLSAHEPRRPIRLKSATQLSCSEFLHSAAYRQMLVEAVPDEKTAIEYSRQVSPTPDDPPIVHALYFGQLSKDYLMLQSDVGSVPFDIADFRYSVAVTDATAKIRIQRWDYSLTFLNRFGIFNFGNTASGPEYPDHALPTGKTTLDLCHSFRNLQTGVYYRQSWSSVADSSRTQSSNTTVGLRPIDNVVAEKGPDPLHCEQPVPSTRSDLKPTSTREANLSTTQAAETAKEASPPRSAIQPAANARWTYGHHPVLGLSAHVDIGNEALGFACIEGDGGWSISDRMTPGLIGLTSQPEIYVAEVYLEPFAVGGVRRYHEYPRGFVEMKGDYCSSRILEFRRSKSLLLLSGGAYGLTFNGPGDTVLDIEEDGRRLEVRRAEDVGKIARSIAVPLTGSSAAIGKLIGSCRKLRREIAEGCDHH